MADLARVTAHHGDIARYFAREDGKSFRGHRQSVEAVKRHVEFLDHKVNGAAQRGNPRNWQFAGSIPMSIVVDYLTERNIPIDVWARNEGGEKDKFMRWLSLTHPKLIPMKAASARPVGRPIRPKREQSIVAAIGA